jgi:hypothetical protein
VGEGDDHSVHSYRSATEESNVTSRGGQPIEVEIMLPKRHGSPLIPTTESSNTKYVQQNASDISSMPADSFLDGKTRSPERKRSRSLTRSEVAAAGIATGLVAGAVSDKLRTPSRRRSRSLSRERIVAQKAVEKVRGDKSERRRKHRSRSRSISGEHLTEGVKSPRRRSSRSHHDDSLLSGGDSQLNSKVSGKSADQYSFRSGTSKSSINNPKLLETVEDAIRRLILPELTALKRDQSKREQRERHRRGSLTSGSGVSKDSVEDYSSTRRQSDHGSSTDLSTRPKVTLNDGEIISGNSVKGRKDKNRNIDRLKAEDSPQGFERETSEETVTQDRQERSRKKRSSDKHRGLEAAALGAGIGLTAAALRKNHSSEALDEKKERRRRRTKSRSRSDSMADSYDEREHEAVPPMPLMSEINASEITRSSILSADTERPHSASQEHVTPIREVPRGVASPASRTPTLTPVALQKSLGTQHSNFSRGNLSLHSQPSEQQLHTQEYELDEHGHKVLAHSDDYEDSLIEEVHNGGHSHALAAGPAGAAAGAGLGALHQHHQLEEHDDPELLEDDDYGYEQNYQEVPPPLKYIPYGQDRRGLSPIQSVSGYTEGDPDVRNSRLTRSTGSYSSMGKSTKHKESARSMRSLDSAGVVHGNHHDFKDVRQGGLTDSELTQDGEYWEEQHRENDRNREIDAESYRSSDPRVDYKGMTHYTDDDDSLDAQDLDRINDGQNIRGIGANPDYVRTPIAVESAVASLVNASDLTGTSGQYDRRGSYASFEDGSERLFTSRGNSPSKHDTFGARQRASSQQNSPTKYVEEYEPDEQGRKVEMPKYKNSHSTEKAALAGIAAGAAAHILKGRNKKSSADQIQYEDINEETGAPLHKSYKDRALQGQGLVSLSPAQSIGVSEAASLEQLKMGASGLPDAQHPMPEIGFIDHESDVTTNPSIIHGPAQNSNRDHWPEQTPSPQKRHDTPNRSPEHAANLKAAEAALIGAAAGAGASAAIAGHNRNVSKDNDDERTSGERKRDTIITNPYEGTSPIAAVGEHSLLGHEFVGTQLPAYHTSSPGVPKDEGYISSAPNARSPGAITPEPRVKGVNFMGEDNGAGVGEDPFYTPQDGRHMSGLSHGMDSPFYDSATGTGIDRIQSRDIVALMDHVRYIASCHWPLIANIL